MIIRDNLYQDILNRDTEEVYSYSPIYCEAIERQQLWQSKVTSIEKYRNKENKKLSPLSGDPLLLATIRKPCKYLP